jgi:hypothetical protein
LLAWFPELAKTVGPNYNNLHLVLHGIRSQNPRRAAAIEFSLAQQQKSFDEWRGLQWQIQNQQDRANKAFVQQQDALFSERRPEMKSPAFAHQMGSDTLDYLQSLGATRQEVAQAWKTPAFHNHILQQALMDAAKYHKAAKNVSQRRSNKAPNVMRPGSATEPPGRSAPKIQDFNGSEAAQLRAAASALTARRTARR